MMIGLRTTEHVTLIIQEFEHFHLSSMHCHSLASLFSWFSFFELFFQSQLSLAYLIVLFYIVDWHNRKSNDEE